MKAKLQILGLSSRLELFFTNLGDYNLYSGKEPAWVLEKFKIGKNR